MELYYITFIQMRTQVVQPWHHQLELIQLEIVQRVLRDRFSGLKKCDVVSAQFTKSGQALECLNSNNSNTFAQT